MNMGLRDKVTLLFICVMFYQISCMPRRCKNNFAYKSRSPSPKYGKQMNRPPPTIVYNNAAQKSQVPKFKWEVPDVPEFDKNLPTARDKTWSIPNVPEFERTYELSKLSQKSPLETAKDRVKTPVTEWNWEVPEVPDFENNFDLSKLCLTPPPVPCKKCKCGSNASTPFNPFPEPFCFKEMGSFPEVDYPLDVKDFRIPNYWNDFIENKLKQQGKEIDQACTQLYQGKSNTTPRPNNKAIEKAVNALLKSQIVNKPAPAPVPSSIPGLDNSDKCNKSSDSTNDIMSPCEIEQEPVTNNLVTSSIPVLADDKYSDYSDDLCVPCIDDEVPSTEMVEPSKDIVCKPKVAQALPDPTPNIVESVISKPTEDIGRKPQQKDEKSTEKSVSPPINDKVPVPDPIRELVEPLLKDIIAKPIEDVIAQTLLQDNTMKSTENALPPINDIVPDSMPDIVEPLLKDIISNPTGVKSTEKKEQILFHKIFSTLSEDNTILPAEDIVSKPMENDPASINEILLCSPINCSRTYVSPSSDVPSKSNNIEQNKPSIDEVLSTDEILKTNPGPSSIVPSLDELPTESVTGITKESGVKKVLIDSLLAISNMNSSQKETLDPPAAQNTLADDEDDFGFATLPPTDEEAPRVVRSCSYKDSSLFLCPEDLDYMILVSI